MASDMASIRISIVWAVVEVVLISANLISLFPGKRESGRNFQVKANHKDTKVVHFVPFVP